MKYIKAVRKGIDYIEENLDSDIPLSNVARAAGLSQWHFQRIFKALTNETLKTYIRSRRLANALDKLLLSDERIIDIALSSGYESQESFTRAFKSKFGLNPNEYRQIGDKNLFFKKIEFDENYLNNLNKNIILLPEIKFHSAKKIVGLKTTFYGIDSEKSNITAKLPSLWSDFSARLNEVEEAITGVYYGVVKQIKSDDDLLEYYAGIEVKRVDFLPKNMNIIDIPSSHYARFTHRGPADQVNNTVNYIYSSWLLRSGFAHTQGPDLEIYSSSLGPLSSDSMMQYAIPIQRQ